MTYRFFAVLMLIAAAGCGGTSQSYTSSNQSSMTSSERDPSLNAASYNGVVPAMDSSRAISEEDCSKAFDPFRGNLRCK